MKIFFRSNEQKKAIRLNNFIFLTNKHLSFENLNMKIDNAENNTFLDEYPYYIKIYEKGSLALKVNFIKIFKLYKI